MGLLDGILERRIIKYHKQILITMYLHITIVNMIKLEIPEDMLKNFDIKDTTQLKQIIKMGIKQMRIEKALQSYEKGKISLAKAAELADIQLSEMMMQASARGLKPLYDKKIKEEEMQ
jgi:predicted HTH domain antitoxin